LIYSTLIGGTGDERLSVGGIAVDRGGRAYAAAETSSSDFPMANAWQPTIAGGPDGVIARLNATGDDLEYSTYFGGTGGDGLRDVAIDSVGNAYVAGYTDSRDLPLRYPVQPLLGGYPNRSTDMMIAKFNPSGSLVFSTYLGGGVEEQERGVAADDAGNVYVTGIVDLGLACCQIGDDDPRRYPLTKPLWTLGHGFLAKIHTPDEVQEGRIIYSTRISGYTTGVASDREGNAYVTGGYDGGLPLPPVDADQPAFAGGGSDAFLMKIRPDGQGVVYATFYGNADYGESSDVVAVGADGSANIAGYRQLWIPGSAPGTPDAFFAHFNPSGRLGDSAVFASAGVDREDDAWALAVDIWGNVYVAGEWNFDIHSQVTSQDGFIVKLDGQFLDIPPDCRDCVQDIGLPVNLFSGSVWLNQTDVVLPGVMGIEFTRSYNSIGTREPTDSGFGPGWTHPFEQNLAFAPSGLRLRQANGLPVTFTSSDHVTYRALAPATETSWIVKASDGFTRSFRQGGSEVYDVQGRLTTIKDAVGNETALTWDGLLLTRVRDPGGRELTLAYSGANLIRLTGPAGVIASYSYGSSGTLETVTYADGTGYRFVYDSLGRLLQMTDATGRPLETHTYDDQGRALTSEVANGIEKVTLTYSPGETSVTDALANTAVYAWSMFGGTNKVTSRTGACASCGGAETEQWTYYPDGRVHTHQVGDDPASTYTYFSTGEVESVTDTLGRTTNFTYDDKGRILTRTAPGVGTTTWTQSDAGPLTITTPVTATQTRTTTFTYSAQAKLETVVDSAAHVTRNVYDSLGDLRTVRDALNHETHFTYDVMGRRTQVTDPLGHGPTTEYDAVGRVRRVTTQDGKSTQISYNARGQRASVTDARGAKTEYVYDPYGRLQTVLDADRNATRYSYDALSRMVALKDAEDRTTIFDYDAQGRLRRTIYPGGRSETLTYEPAGRLKTRLDRKGVTTTYVYDGGGRLRTKSYSDGSPSVTFEYDDADRLLSGANGSDTVTRTYDLAGATLTESSAANSSTVLVAYDTLGRRASLTIDPGPAVATYTYDEVSRLKTITDGSQHFDFEYDDAGRRTSLGFPSGVTTTYAYDDVDRLAMIAASRGATVIAQAAYTYDAVGNRISKATPARTEAYEYDSLWRLTLVDRGSGGFSSFNYDRIGSRRHTQVGSRIITASLNERNELTANAAGGTLKTRGQLTEPGSVVVAGKTAALLPGGLFEGEADVSEGTNDVLVEATDATGNVRRNTYRVTVPGVSEQFAYDLNGNMVSRNDAGHEWTYEWTVENQLARVTRDGVEVVRFSYDPFGRRIEKTVGAQASRYIYDGDDILQQTINGAVNRYLHGPGVDEPLGQAAGGTAITGYFHADGLGSIVSMTDASGNVTLTRQYDAWGNLEIGAAEPGYAFTGREWDPETGLYYYRARYYDPKVGRFIGEDPIGFAGGINAYTYVAGNPVNFVDPSGLVLRTAALATMQAIAGSAAGRVQIVNGEIDVSRLTQQDLTGNEGALLIHQLATSRFVYTYDESACPGGLSNLDNRSDWRYRGGKQSRFLPPTGVDDAVTIDPSARWVDRTSGLPVSLAATAFHELAEAYAKIDLGLPYMFKGSTAGAHADAVRREQILIGQSPGFTQAAAGGSLRRVQ